MQTVGRMSQLALDALMIGQWTIASYIASYETCLVITLENAAKPLES